MKMFKKIFAWLTGIIAVAFVLILLAVLMSPLWLNQEVVKKTLVDAISQQLGGRLHYNRIDVLLLPRPHVVLYRSRFQLNDNVEGVISSIGIFPKIIPLIDGRIQISKVRVERPDIRMAVDSAPSWPPVPRYAPKPVMDIIERIFSHPALKSDSTFEFKNGRFRMESPRHRHQFQQIEARIRRGPNDGLWYSIHCNSSLWDSLSVKGRLRLTTARGNGHLKCINFRPQTIFARSSAGPAIQTIDGRLNIDLAYSTTSPTDLNLEATGEVPYWVLRKGIEEAEIKIKRFNAVVNLTPDHLALSIANLDISKPAAQLSGNFIYDRLHSNVRLDLACFGVDASAIRKNALSLTGDIPLIKDVFNIIQSGQVPTLRLNAKGRTLKDLALIRNYLVKGHMRNGRIYIPGPDLDLNDVSGEVVIADGVLRGSGLSARLGNSSGRDGQLTLGLVSIAEPFALDILVEADLTQLPAVLAAQIPNRSFGTEMRQLKIPSGSASGRLILEQTEGMIQPVVQVFDAELQADYQRIPYPVKLRIASMQYQDSQIHFEIPEAMVGDSILSNLLVAVDWRGPPHIDIINEKAELRVAQAYACLAHTMPGHRLEQNLSVSGGRGFIHNLRIHGPAHRFDQWEMSMTGTLQEVPLTWPSSGESTTVRKSAFEVLENSLDPEIDSEIKIHHTELQWGSSRIGMKGSAALIGPQVRLDIEATADSLDAAQLEFVDGDASNEWRRHLSGQIRIASGQFTYGDWAWRNIQADVRMEPRETIVQVSQADLCGISTTAAITLKPRPVQVSIYPIAAEMALSPAIACLFDRNDVITGNFNLSGQLHATPQNGEWTRSLTGSVVAVAESGRIYRYTALSKILALINITEVFKGKLPDLTQGGFAYKSITVKGDIRSGQLMVSEMIIDAASMTIVARGNYHLTTRQLQFTVLVAPLKSIDTIIKNLPVTSLMFGNTLVSFPFLIEGTPDNFDVTLTSPSAVAPELSKVLNRTVKGPDTIYQPPPKGSSRIIDN